LPNDWTPARRVAFRFSVVYLTLFVLTTQISGSLIPNPWFTYRGLGRLWPVRGLTHWVARTFFGIDPPLDDVSGGETLFFWIQWSWVIASALMVAVAWSLFDRRAAFARYELPRARLGAWWRLAIRLALAASMIEYGMTKVIPTQFPTPPLMALVTPVGDMTLSALLWTTIGSAPAYEIATGVVEVVAGVLLLLPRTVTLGALLGLASLTQVLLLNLTFDIGVKLVTMHLIALAVILLVPMVRLKPDTTIEVRLKADTTPALLPIVLGAYLLGMQTWINWSFWQAGGGGQPKSVLYGIWNVERLSVDGQVGPPQSNDYDRRWRRVIFDQPDAVVFQRTDDSFARYGASIDRGSGTVALTKGNSRTWASRFTFDRSSGDRLSLDGEMDGHRIQAELRRVDLSAFPLLNSRFRWVRPHDP
jgi:uncharacterized membrane protein YphA (DoxX/SURF4 family)